MFNRLCLWKHSGSVVECLIRDRGVAGWSLIGVTVLCLWARHVYPCLVLVQPRKTRPHITEKMLTGTYRIELNKQTNKQTKPLSLSLSVFVCVCVCVCVYFVQIMLMFYHLGFSVSVYLCLSLSLSLSLSRQIDSGRVYFSYSTTHIRLVWRIEF